MSPTEYKAIQSLWQENFGDSPKFIAEYLDKFATDYNIEILFSVEGEAIGMGHSPEFVCEIGNVSYLYALCVNILYRNQGFARVIVDNILKKSFEKGLVACITIPEPASLRDWYKDKFGFALISPVQPIEFISKQDFDCGSDEKQNDIGMVRIVNPLKYLELYVSLYPDLYCNIRIEDDIITENNICLSINHGKLEKIEEKLNIKTLSIYRLYENFFLPIKCLKSLK